MVKLVNLTFKLSSRAREDTPTLVRNTFADLELSDQHTYKKTWILLERASELPWEQPIIMDYVKKCVKFLTWIGLSLVGLEGEELTWKKWLLFGVKGK